jgi:hypothetical protein
MPNKAPKLVDRRRMMKAVAASGGAITGMALLPEKWVTPIIQSVYLPAHAETTSDSSPTPTSGPTPTVGPTPTPSE